MDYKLLLIILSIILVIGLTIMAYGIYTENVKAILGGYGICLIDIIIML